MSSEPFDPLPDDARVFRLAETGSHFLPEGARLPTREIFQPTTDDIEEGRQRDREPGVSVWDEARTTVPQAATIRYDREDYPEGIKAFALVVGTIRTLGVENDRRIDVVADPRIGDDWPGADGHCAIEGLQRPRGYPKRQHKALLVGLVEACNELPFSG